jgi:hypothetical protein
MQLDNLLIRYFGVTDLARSTPAGVEAGVEKALVDFGLECDPGKRFALWAMLHLLGRAPDLDVAFKDESDREAARNFMDLLAASDGDFTR